MTAYTFRVYLEALVQQGRDATAKRLMAEADTFCLMGYELDELAISQGDPNDSMQKEQIVTASMLAPDA